MLIKPGNVWSIFAPMSGEIKLTQFSHGAGCGCKLSPEVLSKIIGKSSIPNPLLLVGNDTKDDAVVYNLEDGTAIISTTDFFTPIVDDPFDFGRIAAANALSDVYAMGGTPLVAIAILGWPIEKLSAEQASKVLKGARVVCADAKIQLAGGHSIDTPEPIFGLAVTGKVEIVNLKKNSTAKVGSALYLTKPLGVGIITTAQKKGLSTAEDLQNAVESMTKLNTEGQKFSQLDYVNAMTDVTGFGLLGHLVEMCEGSEVSSVIQEKMVPLLPNVQKYIKEGAIPGGTKRNWKSYQDKVEGVTDLSQSILADPQTSGGLLVSVSSIHEDDFEKFCADQEINFYRIGSIVDKRERPVYVKSTGG